MTLPPNACQKCGHARDVHLGPYRICDWASCMCWEFADASETGPSCVYCGAQNCQRPHLIFAKALVDVSNVPIDELNKYTHQIQHASGPGTDVKLKERRGQRILRVFRPG